MSKDRLMQSDPRVNASFMTPKKYLIILLLVGFVSGSNVGLYFLLSGDGVLQISLSQTIRIILIMLTYLVLMTCAICQLVTWYRNSILLGPTRCLCRAAQQVAHGDYSVRLAPMRTDGKKDEFEVLFEDFNTMVEELGSTELLKNDFVSTVSHELKTPLAVIENYAALLQNPDLSEREREDFSARILDASRRMSVLVTNILQVNRLDNQKIHPKKLPFNASEAIARCILNYDEKLTEKNIELDTDLDEDLILNQDENLLDCVWTNLLSNAVKFTPEGGRIRVSLQQEAGNAAVCVTDSGCGIRESDLHHIFDKFYQADTSHATEGNGLGLALVRRIIDLCGGTVTVDSHPGQGASFTVRIPLC